MTKRHKVPSGCVMQPLFSTLGKPWMLQILWVLGQQGEMRFGALRRAVEGISARMLTERLRELEQKGFVYRHHNPTIPPQVSYGPTEQMRELDVFLSNLHDVAQKWHLAPEGDSLPHTQAIENGGKPRDKSVA